MLIGINNFGSEATATQINSLREKISNKLSRFESQLTRIEAYFKDANGPTKQGLDKQCKLEARLKSQPMPVVVSADGVSEEQTLHDAADKMVTLLTRIIEKSQESRQNANQN